MNERNHATGEQRFTSSIHFLLGFLIELYLKAALAQAQVPSNQRFGHVYVFGQESFAPLDKISERFAFLRRLIASRSPVLYLDIIKALPS